MSKLPSRGPRVMNGLHSLLAQARPLPAALSGVAQPAKVVTPTPAQADQLRAQLAVFKRLAVAEQQVANVRKVLDNFEAQCAKLPPGQPARALIEQACGVLRTALAVAEQAKG
jgi:hypothetical protein